MALSIEEETELAALRVAYSQIISGKAVAKVTSNGRSVEYSQANLARLELRISGLEKGKRRRRGGAVGFRF